MPQNSGINKIFFQDFFDKCPVLGWLLLKPLLKCFLSEKSDKSSDKEEIKEEGKKKEPVNSTHQRLLAVEMVGHLIKASENNEEAMKLMKKNLQLLTSILIKVVDSVNTWGNKKVQKTGQCINLFTKSAKILLKSKESNDVTLISEQGARLVNALQAACEKDKTMSNLKGKAKEISRLVKNA